MAPIAIAATDDLGPGPPIDQLGWHGRHSYDDPEVAAMRQRLEQSNGLPGLELVAPEEAGFAERAARLFLRDGFVCVLRVLGSERLEVCRSGCIKAVRRIMAVDPQAGGNGHPSYFHGTHRYSITGEGAVVANMGATPEFVQLAEPPVLHAVLAAIYGSSDYRCNGFGGDFCLPGAVAFQPLHSDQDGAFKVEKQARATPEYDSRLSLSEPSKLGVEYEYKNGFHDPSGRLTYRDLPPAYVVANYPMELVPGSPVGASRTNGPTRQIPGTHHSHAAIPTIDEEPTWMKLATCCPTPAGAVLLRDPRAWHGGTPNLSRHTRAIPSAGFLAPWCAPGYRGEPEPCIAGSVFSSLSPAGQRACQLLLAPVAVPVPVTVYSRVSAYSVGKRATATELDLQLLEELDATAAARRQGQQGQLPRGGEGANRQARL